ncbi:hypothetical protein SADUNF_Sadunf18G0049200 [Salix dunnii]|uniref:Uncharacterized protein n=1 Tax=Salix dunnii TaxID=1413687 RepID=A0A835J618_9ROSI|nr:hypothetical protein SADUNF_Sadunf18G0049200 [Salix dunnii]
MDFHCLSRKELQDLCKKNKIPANMANVSIAEALEVLLKTPVTRSSRRMVPVVSARGKVEAQNEHKSVQGVYKSRSAMGLKEKERVRPLKMDGPCWEIEDVKTKDENAAEFSYCKSIKKRRSLMNNLSTTDAGKLRMLKRRMREIHQPSSYLDLTKISGMTIMTSNQTLQMWMISGLTIITFNQLCKCGKVW